MIGNALMMIPFLVGCSVAPGPGGDGADAPAAPDTVTVTRGSHTDAAGTRAWRLVLPQGATQGATQRAAEAGRPAPLLVLLHGCTQDADDVALSTRMDAQATARGVAVLYPEQDPGAHPLRCWNWYEPAHQGREAGEPAILAGMIRTVVEDHGLDPARVFVAGMSAGGAMAAILAANYPELVAGVASHSGVPFGIARGLPAATAALSGTLEVDADAAAEAVRSAMGDRARDIPTLIIHGSEDAVVSPRNAGWGWEQAMRLRASAGPDSVRVATGYGRGQTGRADALNRDEWTFPAEGPPLLRRVYVMGLGHAWSGGAPEGSYTDPRGPDASRMILDFFLGPERGDDR